MNEWIRKLVHWLKILSKLIKIKITITVSLTTALGYIFVTKSIHLKMLLPILGLFFLACGSAALNEIQERKIDALMRRTKDRPLPSGAISPEYALLISTLFILIGVLILYFGTNITALILGVFTAIWYNIIYTPLKQRTAFAFVPGALIGAMPPLIGYTAAGGNILSTQILIISYFFFIWQIPHFWLLLLIHEEDYKNAYLPVLTGMFTINQLAKITFTWIITLVITSLLFPLYQVFQSKLVLFFLIIIAGWLIWNSIKLLQAQIHPQLFKHTFIKINIYALLIIFILALDKLLYHRFS